MRFGTRGLVSHPESNAQHASPEALVTAFICAMNEWELRAHAAARAARDASNPASFWPAVTDAMERVFAEYCTPRKRPHGRAGSFQRPPEYAPELERITGSEINGDRAWVETYRNAVVGGGARRYALQRRGGRWLIDNVQQQDGDSWTRTHL